MFEEGFKRYNSVKILKVFFGKDTIDASITYKTDSDKVPRFAIIDPTYLEEFTTVGEDCSMLAYKRENYQDMDKYKEAILCEFTNALKENLPVNLVVAVIKKGRNVEFIARAEFL